MIAFKDVTFAFGANEILNNISFFIKPSDKIALIGRNGAGKTTLFELIYGNYSPQKGSIERQKNIKIGYLPQYIKTTDTTTLWNETINAFNEVIKYKSKLEELHKKLENCNDLNESKNILLELDKVNNWLHYNQANTIEKRTEQVLTGLGFKKNDFNRNTKEFSGGWRIRIELAKLLLNNPNLILLDEPTNHLDIESIQWLEDYLINFKGAVIIVSHDVAFLNNVTNRTIEIINGKIYDYELKYNDFVKFREVQIISQKQALLNQQKQIEQAEKFIEQFRYKATKARQVQSKIKQLEKLEKITIDEVDNKNITLRFPPALHCGTIVCEIKNLHKSFDNNKVLNGIDFTITRGEKIALVGKNGEGKTTFVKIIKNELDFEGEVKLGYQVKIGYFAQNQDEALDLNKTVLQTLEDVAPIEVRPQIRKILGYFLFSGDNVYKKLSVLSGGEKARLLLAKLLLEPVNFLILDEPTNHLDVPSKMILKEAIKNYDGTVLIISHDRDFLNGLVDRIIEIKNGKFKEYIGDIWEFLKYKKYENFDLVFNKEFTNKSIKQNTDNKENTEYLEKKELERKIRKIENSIKNIEKALLDIEKQIAEREKLIHSNDIKVLSDYKWFEEFEKLKQENDNLFNKLDELIREKESLIKEKQLKFY